MSRPDMSYLTDIYLGPGRVRVVPEVAARHGIRRPLIITDPALSHLGVVGRLGLNAPVVYDGVQTNPTEALVTEALDCYREAGCDGLVAIGGGSSIDLAKCVAMLVHHPGPLRRYAAVSGGDALDGPVPALIAVPTTAGSGSEVGRAALATVFDGRKLGFIHSRLTPVAAVCDPELTISMPSGLTAGTAMDAISHGVETFCSPRWNPVADILALDGLARGIGHVRIVFREGDNLEARREMMLASIETGLAFQKGLGAVHALSHPLGGMTERRLHHGTLNALLLPHVLRYNFDACPKKMAAMAGRLEVDRPRELPEVFAGLVEDLALPTRLRDLGLTREELPAPARLAAADHCVTTNPRQLHEPACFALYETAW